MPAPRDLDTVYNELKAHAVRRVSETYTLDRVSSALGKLGNPQDSVPTIHVAGTSGKTSTATYIAAMLRKGGLRVGLTVSPHIEKVTERIQLDGSPISDTLFIELFESVARRLGESFNLLSYFEVLTILAFEAFANSRLDVAVVETGLGGRLDATNTVHNSSKLCVITDIGLDHTEILGDTLPKIAGEKSGIIHSGNLVVMNKQAVDIDAVFADRCNRVGAVLHVAEAPRDDFMARNATLARVAVSLAQTRFGWSLSAGDLLLDSDTSVPGRYEEVGYRGRMIMLDGAHNPQKIRALTRKVRADDARPIACLANLTQAPDAKILETAASLAELANYVIVCRFDSGQDVAKPSVDPRLFRDALIAAGVPTVELAPTVEGGLARLIRQRRSRLVVTGSLYLVAEARGLIGADEREHERGGE